MPHRKFELRSCRPSSTGGAYRAQTDEQNIDLLFPSVSQYTGFFLLGRRKDGPLANGEAAGGALALFRSSPFLIATMSWSSAQINLGIVLMEQGFMRKFHD